MRNANSFLGPFGLVSADAEVFPLDSSGQLWLMLCHDGIGSSYTLFVEQELIEHLDVTVQLNVWRCFLHNLFLSLWQRSCVPTFLCI